MLFTKLISHASFRADENLRREIERKPTDKAVGFLSSVRFLRAHRKYAHRIHSFCKRQGFAKLSALAQKRGFACAINY